MPKRMNKITGPFVLFLLLCFQVFAQSDLKPVYTLKITEAVEINGLLDEPFWNKAPEASDLMQFRPGAAGEGAVTTSIKILYDDSFLYVGFLCYDSQPEKIESLMTDKDEDLRDDDSVYVLVDAAHDRENYYYFATNPNGVQLDGKISLDGRIADPTWDGVWRCAVQKTDFGWSAEMAIELASLEYHTKKEKVLGISLARVVPRMLQSSFLTGALDPAFKIPQLGQLERIDLARAERKVKITPHLISTFEAGKEGEYGAGLDFRYDFNRRGYGRLILYPDFDTVEADEEQINLTRYELYLPEKREYFQQGSSLYDQKIRLFYSKRIFDIIGGVKLYGRTGGFELSGMSVQAEKDDLTNQESANYSVVRLKTNFMKSSSFGILASNKLINGKNIGAAGVDTFIRFSNTLSLSGQFAYSYGNSEEENIAFFIRPSYQSKSFRIQLSYIQLEENFGDNVNEVGFIPDDNRKELNSGIGVTFIKDKGNVEEFAYDSNYNVFWGMNNALRSWQVDQGFTVEFKNKFALVAKHTQEFKAQDDFLYERDFRNNKTTVGILFNAKEWEYATLEVSVGRNFGWNFNMMEIGKNFHVTRTLDLEFFLARTYFTFGRSGRNDFVTSIRAINRINEKFFVRLFYQYRSMIEKFNVELLINYSFLPPSGYAQLVYQMGRARFGEVYGPGNRLFLKIGTTF